MSNVREEELYDLEDSKTWEDEPFAVQQPSKPSRAVVSVAFSRDDFARVAQFARVNGMKTSEFIRTAALERLAGKALGTSVAEVTISNGGFRVYDFTETSRSLNFKPDLASARLIGD